jgi:N-acyl-D-amino-acid deacylase
VSDYSLVIRNGVVVDGTGMPPYRSDVGISGKRIVTIGRITDVGQHEIDAEGHVVAPGFIDGHTHMDAQVFWDPMGTSACWHGVTTAVMGNCGFTLAPVKADERDLVLNNLERAEDIPREAMAQGVRWGFEHFCEYLDVLDSIPKGINYAANIGHSALRTWAMGQRAFEEDASDDDLALMVTELEEGLRAGAVGFTTSRSNNHVASDGRPVASRLAPWSEVTALVGAMADAGGGVFELANESVASSSDPAARGEYASRLRALAVATRVPITFGITSFGDRVRWQEQVALLESTALLGGHLVGQSRCRESSVVYSFKTWLPFDGIPEWRDLRSRPLRDQAELLRNDGVRRTLIDSASRASYTLGASQPQPMDWDAIRVMDDPVRANPGLATLAAARGMSPPELFIDLSLRSDFDQLFVRVTGNADLGDVETILRHPRTVMTFSDSGAHVSQMINSSLQTHLLAFWVRQLGVLSLEEAVRMITLVPAVMWGIPDRGVILEGAIADLNVFDPESISPDLPKVAEDLPGGAKRLTQTASGILATVVGGQIVLRSGQQTGALPGSLIRRHRFAQS